MSRSRHVPWSGSTRDFLKERLDGVPKPLVLDKDVAEDEGWLALLGVYPKVAEDDPELD